MKRIIVSLLIALPISVVVTAVLLFASAVFTPLGSVFFPYGSLINDISVRTGISTQYDRWIYTSWLYINGAALLLQWPFYAIVIAIANGWRKWLLVSVPILIIHAIAAAASLTMDLWW